MDVVNKAYLSLQNNGKLVIVLGGDELQKSELIKHFGGDTIQIDRLARQCSDTFGNSCVSLFQSEEAFYAKTQEAMLHIAAFMLKDANITARRDDLIHYIDGHFKRSDGQYEMTTKQKYIVIEKTEIKDTDIFNEAKVATTQNK